jgi:prepilin-type N-terminal cleavage/methylation domain-containing protein
MTKFMKRMHRGEKGFTLIELLVVIAILGIIAAVVALNVGTFFGRGTLQAANTELHQCQTAIISAMADGQTGKLTAPASNLTANWDGGPNVVYVTVANVTYDAADYIYGLFRAEYTIDNDGAIISGNANITGGWGSGIAWDTANGDWITAP